MPASRACSKYIGRSDKIQIQKTPVETGVFADHPPEFADRAAYSFTSSPEQLDYWNRQH